METSKSFPKGNIAVWWFLKLRLDNQGQSEDMIQPAERPHTFSAQGYAWKPMFLRPPPPPEVSEDEFFGEDDQEAALEVESEDEE